MYIYRYILFCYLLVNYYILHIISFSYFPGSVPGPRSADLAGRKIKLGPMVMPAPKRDPAKRRT